MNYDCPAWDFATFGIAAPTKQGSPHHLQISKAYTGPRVAHGFACTVFMIT
jgi:hypothetical protein